MPESVEVKFVGAAPFPEFSGHFIASLRRPSFVLVAR